MVHKILKVSVLSYQESAFTEKVLYLWPEKTTHEFPLKYFKSMETYFRP